MEKHRAAPQEREAQEVLARFATESLHGPANTAEAAAATDALFGGRSLESLSRDEREAVIREVPSLALSKKELEAGYPLTEALVGGKLASSKSDARRLIEGKAVTLSGLLIENADQKLYPGDLSGGLALIRKGKRDVLVLVLK